METRNDCLPITVRTIPLPYFAWSFHFVNFQTPASTVGSSWSIVLRKQMLPHSNITPCHGTRSFVTVLTRARHLSLLRICVKECCSVFCFRCRAVFVVGSQFLPNRIRHRGSNNHRQPHNPISNTTPYVRLPYCVPPPPKQQYPSTKSKFVFFVSWHWGSPPSLSLPLRINQSVR